MRIFLSAGEASGDAYAAALVKHLKMAGEGFTFEGVGGGKLREAIGALVADSSTWGAVSIVQSLKVAVRAYRGGMKARAHMAKGPPGLFIGIDFGFFNIRQCRWAKAHGWKVLYFMPPSSWRRDHQGRDLPAITDAVVTPFPWSAELLKGIGVNAYFFGHPLKQLIRESGVVPTDGETIAALPGSRRHELERNLPLIAECIAGKSGDWQGKFENAILTENISKAREPLTRRIEFAIAPNVDAGEIRSRWNELAPGRDDIFTSGDTYGVLARARAAIVCSGTATLEAAYIRCPLVVVYRITNAMAREAKLIRFKPPKYLSLPNVILDRKVVPEMAGLEIDPSAIRSELDALLADSPQRAGQLAAFEEVERSLGKGDAITATVDLIRKMIR